MVVIIRAPFSFEIEQIEIEIGMLRKQVVDKPHLDVVDRVSEGAVLSVFALMNFTRVTVAELSLVLVLVVKAFYSVMRPSALIPLGTFFGVRELAKLRGVEQVVPPLVLDRVKIVAALVVVGYVFTGTFEPLEICQVEVLHCERVLGPLRCLCELDEVRGGSSACGLSLS